MPLFNEIQTMAPSEHYDAPKYMKDTLALKLLGYKTTGEHNNWGKVLGWIQPGASIGGDIALKSMAKKNGADDVAGNLDAVLKRDIQKGITTAEIAGEVALTAATGGAAAPLLAKTIGTAAKGAASVSAMDKVNTADDASSFYTYYAKGGKMKQGEDVAMLDKKTGQKVGEISYGEGILSENDYAKMKKLAAEKKYMQLGKFAAAVCEKHKEVDEERGEMQMRKGGGGLDKPNIRKVATKNGIIFLDDKNQQAFDYDGKELVYKDYVRIDPINEATRFGINNGIDAINAFEFVDGYKDMNDPYNPIGIHGYMHNKGHEAYLHNKNMPVFKEGGKVMPYYADAGTVINPLQQSMADQQRLLHESYALNGDASGDINGITNMSPESLSFLKANAGEVYPLAQALTGLVGTGGKTPEFEKSVHWNDLVNRAEAQSKQGLSAQEKAAMHQASIDAYTIGNENSRNASGGSNAFQLGAAGALSDVYRKGEWNIAAMDEATKRQHFRDLYPIVAHDQALDKAKFDERLTQFKDEKTAAAQLANTGLQSMIDNKQYDKSYGEGSMYEKYMKALTDAAKQNGGINMLPQNTAPIYTDGYINPIPPIQGGAPPAPPQQEAPVPPTTTQSGDRNVDLKNIYQNSPDLQGRYKTDAEFIDAVIQLRDFTDPYTKAPLDLNTIPQKDWDKFLTDWKLK